MAADRIPDPELIGPRPKADRSIGSLLSDLATEVSLLLRQEVALAKAEISEKVGRIVQGVAALAAGGLVAFSGFLVLLLAAVLGLAEFVAPWLAALIVGLVVVAIGVGLLFLGKSRFEAEGLVPRRTINSLREDEQWVRRQVR